MPQPSQVAQMDPSFAKGKPGTYQVGVRVPALKYSTPKAENFSPARWQELFSQEGVGGRARVLKVDRAVPHITNPVTPYFGEGYADFNYVLTVEIKASPSGMSGLGVAWVPVAVGIVVAIELGFYLFAGKTPILDYVSRVGGAVGGSLGKVGLGAIIPALVVVGLLYAATKSKVKVRTGAFNLG